MRRRDFLKALGTSMGAALVSALGLHRFKISHSFHEVQESRYLLGTFVTLTVHHPDVAEAENAIYKAFAAIQEVDRIMSLHRLDSDLSKVNALAGEAKPTVHPWLIDVLKTARRAHEISGKQYDITCLPLMKLYGFYSHPGEKHPCPADREIYSVLDLVNQRTIELDAARMQVGLLRKGSGMDLGSIGKGFAVDRAVEVLRKLGIEHALVDAGGNIFALGRPQGPTEQEGWRVAIKNPDRASPKPYFEVLSLSHQAVATSGNYEQSVTLEGHKVGHLLQALSGKPAEKGISTTVVADNAAWADAMSTVSFLLGPDEKKRLLPFLQNIYYHGFAS